MGRTFKTIEPGNQPGALSPDFQCAPGGGPVVAIFRLLTGTADLKSDAMEKAIRCRMDFLSLHRSNGRTNDKKVSKRLFGNEINVDDARQIIKKLRLQNVGFFNKLECELSHCVAGIIRRNHLEAFLYFYRALEKLAVAFPMLYASGQSDFQKFHTLLKPLFVDGGGELAFIVKFCEFIISESDILAEYNVTFTIKADTVDDLKTILAEVERVTPKKIWETVAILDSGFEIPYKMTAPFLINARNRMFHNSNDGQPNFDLDRVGGVGELSRSFVVAGLHWLALTYVEVIRNRAGRI